MFSDNILKPFKANINQIVQCLGDSVKLNFIKFINQEEICVLEILDKINAIHKDIVEQVKILHLIESVQFSEKYVVIKPLVF